MSPYCDWLKAPQESTLSNTLSCDALGSSEGKQSKPFYTFNRFIKKILFSGKTSTRTKESSLGVGYLDLCNRYVLEPNQNADFGAT